MRVLQDYRKFSLKEQMVINLKQIPSLVFSE